MNPVNLPDVKVNACYTRIFFHQSLISGCYAVLTSPKEGETAVYGYNPALFWILSVSC